MLLLLLPPPLQLLPPPPNSTVALLSAIQRCHALRTKSPREGREPGRRRGGGAVKAVIPSELAICQTNLLGLCGQPNLTHDDAQTRGNNPPPALQSPLPQREGTR